MKCACVCVQWGQGSQEVSGGCPKASWKRGVLASSEREAQALQTRKGRLK